MCGHKKVHINPGCIGCGLCEAIAPGVFVVNNISTVKEIYDYERNVDGIKRAIQSCPVGAISIQDDIPGKKDM
jgi:ferredoxin